MVIEEAEVRCLTVAGGRLTAWVRGWPHHLTGEDVKVTLNISVQEVDKYSSRSEDSQLHANVKSMTWEILGKG